MDSYNDASGMFNDLDGLNDLSGLNDVYSPRGRVLGDVVPSNRALPLDDRRASVKPSNGRSKYQDPPGFNSKNYAKSSASQANKVANVRNVGASAAPSSGTFAAVLGAFEEYNRMLARSTPAKIVLAATVVHLLLAITFARGKRSVLASVGLLIVGLAICALAAYETDCVVYGGCSNYATALAGVYVFAASLELYLIATGGNSLFKTSH